MNVLFKIALWLVTRTQAGAFAIMGESLVAAYVVMTILVVALVGGMGWLIVAYLSLKGLIGFAIGVVVALALSTRYT
ncbi:hypothetical protein F6X40_09745 [Paraburkholderia sp. UCT31]|uniref:hypothetical protein n=1 Tax=Paraburkholderia sp. UCT31 TaxID=2615209 RepID=UPI001656011A|nr:hypothetical protein [Paraburkholderia sp. UCT31]MBC8737090.1 hypothetical protein [Paraburkholderia sp. UCT31]